MEEKEKGRRKRQKEKGGKTGRMEERKEERLGGSEGRECSSRTISQSPEGLSVHPVGTQLKAAKDTCTVLLCFSRLTS